jgi:hypothetical protein
VAGPRAPQPEPSSVVGADETLPRPVTATRPHLWRGVRAIVISTPTGSHSCRLNVDPTIPPDPPNNQPAAVPCLAGVGRRSITRHEEAPCLTNAC